MLAVKEIAEWIATLEGGDRDIAIALAKERTGLKSFAMAILRMFVIDGGPVDDFAKRFIPEIREEAHDERKHAASTTRKRR